MIFPMTSIFQVVNIQQRLSTGIGIVIETIARMEHDEFLQAAKESEKEKAAIPVFGTPEEAPVTETEEAAKEKEETGKKKKKKGFDVRGIISSLTEIFVPDDID